MTLDIKILKKILELRDKGLTYKEIQQKLHIRRDKISYAIKNKKSILNTIKTIKPKLKPIQESKSKQQILEIEIIKDKVDKYIYRNESYDTDLKVSIEVFQTIVEKLVLAHRITIENAIEQAKFILKIPKREYRKLNPIDRKILNDFYVIRMKKINSN